MEMRTCKEGGGINLMPKKYDLSITVINKKTITPEKRSVTTMCRVIELHCRKHI